MVGANGQTAAPCVTPDIHPPGYERTQMERIAGGATVSPHQSRSDHTILLLAVLESPEHPGGRSLIRVSYSVLDGCSCIYAVAGADLAAHVPALCVSGRARSLAPPGSEQARLMPRGEFDKRIAVPASTFWTGSRHSAISQH